MNNYALKYMVIILLLLFTSCKTNNLVTQKTVANPSLLAVDNLDNIYKVFENRITKFRFENDSIASFFDFNNGNISSIDVKNPLQIMVFYKELQEIILLDNSLTELSKITLNSNENSWIDLACVSNRDNSFWLFSSESQTLNKVDKSLKTINLTKNIGQLLSKKINPVQLIENNNSVYLLDKNKSVLVFDLYGNYVKNIPLSGAKRIKITPKGILYQTEKELLFFNFLSFEKTILLSFEKTVEDVEITKKGVIGISNDKIKIIYKKFK